MVLKNQESACLFILALQIFFIIIKPNKNIQGLKMFDHEYLYTAHAYDTTFSLKEVISIKVALRDLNSFSGFSGLRPIRNSWNRRPEKC